MKKLGILMKIYGFTYLNAAYPVLGNVAEFVAPVLTLRFGPILVRLMNLDFNTGVGR